MINLSMAENFIWSNARLLDRLRFAYHFKGGAAPAVVAALQAYQNPDGGFGNALEPDLRGPVSQPQPVEFALHVLDEIGAMRDPMVQRSLAYLVTITPTDGGGPFALPVGDEYPRAPWWNTGPEPPAAVNPTAAIAGLLHKQRVEHAWLAPATEFAWRAIEADQVRGGYDYLAIFTFLEHVPHRPPPQAPPPRLGPERPP